ncbi:MAG: TonB-dependent receptor [Thermoanaerobaculia bacterium]|nr:TonB-dependent receptor [Thermoanaerobaculia bacterium]
MTAGKARFWGACWLAYTALPVFAQDCHIALRGKIRDNDTREPLAFASVFVQEAGRGAVSDENGYFIVPNLCESATYTITVKHVECDHETRVVRLTENTLLEFYLHHSHVLKEVIVAEKAVAPAPAQASVSVSGSELASAQGVNLGETLKKLPGVSLLNTGATIAKPVIQGLHSNRIAIITNNVALEGQQWGAEHAPEIDPFTAERISVVKGAAGVRYGVGAMAGAIVLEPAELRREAGLGGWLSLGGFSNGLGGVASGALDWHLPGRSLTFRLQGTAKRSGTLRAPDYWLGNTAAAEFDLAAMAGWKTGRWTQHLTASRFTQQLGVLRAAHVGNLTDLRRAIESEVPLQNPDSFTYRIDRPYQSVQHHLLQYKTALRLSEKWKLSGQYSFQYNYRREYDVVRKTGSAAEKPQISFRLWSNTLEHFPIQHWEGGIGIQGIQQLNYVGRGGYIPDFQTYGGSVWALERWRRYPHPWEYEIGARFDYRRSDVSYAEGTFLPPGTSRDTSVHFSNASVTGGVIYHFAKYGRIALHSGYAWRPPHVYELFARGVHFSSATYEEGNRRMRPEKAWNSNLSLEWQAPRVSATLTLFRNAVQDFIYLNPSADSVLTVRGAFPVYRYRQDNAVLQGMDAGASWQVFPAWSVEGRASVLRAFRRVDDPASDKQRKEWLPLMPADRFQYGLKWQRARGKEQAGETYVRLLATTVLRQTRLPAEGLLKAAPDAFTVFSLEAAHTFRLRHKTENHPAGQTLEIGLNIQNMTNLRYREYLNFFRFFADEPGVNVGVRARWRF